MDTNEKGKRYFLDAEAELELQELGEGGLDGADAVGAHGAGEEGESSFCTITFVSSEPEASNDDSG